MQFSQADEQVDLALQLDPNFLPALILKARLLSLLIARILPNVVSSRQAAPGGPTLGQRGSLPHTDPASRCDPPRCSQEAGPAPEEIQLKENITSYCKTLSLIQLIGRLSPPTRSSREPLGHESAFRVADGGLIAATYDAGC
jgi:hypothetical protein